jgi:hypothetical protein
MHHDHHHRPARQHKAGWSLLAAPVWQRILFALPLIGLLWLGVYWAMPA